MTPINTYSLIGRSAAYHQRRNFQTDALMNMDLHDCGGKIRPSPSTGRHVLLVQKQAIELKAMAKMLSTLGYRVTPAAQSGKALLYFGREHCELVISELDMPQLNGFQLARRIREHSPQIRILLTTACCQAEVVDLMASQVVDGWLFKPFRLSVLSDMLNSINWS